MTNTEFDTISISLSNEDIETIMSASQLAINYAAVQSMQSDELLQKLLTFKTQVVPGGIAIANDFSPEEVILMKNFISHGANPGDKTLHAYLDKSLHEKGI